MDNAKTMREFAKEMRTSLEGEIDFENRDEINEVSNEFAFGTVEEEFRRLVYGVK